MARASGIKCDKCGEIMHHEFYDVEIGGTVLQLCPVHMRLEVDKMTTDKLSSVTIRRREIQRRAA